jgi:nitrogen-specific signal transduction histidine kinase
VRFATSPDGKKWSRSSRRQGSQAEKASSAKSDFLAKISHEIRTPLNAIIGFSEVMMAERFGPSAVNATANTSRTFTASGGHLLSLINDLLDLSKIEAGRLELTFASVSLNDLTQQCVAIMQPQANRDRIIIRTSLPPSLPQVVADARSVRQIVLNLLVQLDQVHGCLAAGHRIDRPQRQRRRGVARARHRRRDERKGPGDRARTVPAVGDPVSGVSGGTGLGLPLTKAWRRPTARASTSGARRRKARWSKSPFRRAGAGGVNAQPPWSRWSGARLRCTPGNGSVCM